MTKGGRTWAPAGLPCTGNAARPWGQASLVTSLILGSGPRTALVLPSGLAQRVSPRQATSQASGMLSVSRVRPMPTAMRASAGPVTRWSSASVIASATLT